MRMIANEPTLNRPTHSFRWRKVDKRSGVQLYT